MNQDASQTLLFSPNTLFIHNNSKYSKIVLHIPSREQTIIATTNYPSVLLHPCTKHLFPSPSSFPYNLLHLILILAPIHIFPPNPKALKSKILPPTINNNSIDMPKQLAHTYRQFSRQRYNKYRHQFPRMRESDIVMRIIKEWEKMDTPKKNDLTERYIANNSLKKDDDNHSCYSTAHKTGQKAALTYSPTPYSKSHPPKIATVYPPLFPTKKQDELDSDFNRNSQRQSQDHHSQRSSSYFLVVGKEREQANKATSYKNYHYIQFYKHQYAKLLHEHSKWSASQISQIIKLQWKKMRSLVKENTNDKTKVKVKRIMKLISGYKFFKKINETRFMSYENSRHAIKNAWRRLPNQSKKQYDRRGRGETAANERNLLKQTFIIRLQRRLVLTLQQFLKKYSL